MPLENADLDSIIPDDTNRPYDMRQIVKGVVDDANFLEVAEAYAGNLVVGFARIDGRSVGIVGNNPPTWPACWTSPAPRRAPASSASATPSHPHHHLRGRAGLPAGREPGARRHHQERREAALRLPARPRSPRSPSSPASLWRGLLCDGSKHIRTDFNFAYPTAEIAVMGRMGP